MSDETAIEATLDDETKATVEAVVKETLAGLKAELDAKVVPTKEVAEIASKAYAGSTSDLTPQMKAIDDAVGIAKVYGRELHSCNDRECSNKDHGIRAARYIKASIVAKTNGGLLEGTGAVGGYLVPAEYHQDLIPLLRARAVVRAIGTPVYPMKELICYVPRQSAAGTGAWAAEAGAISNSIQTIEQLTLTAKRANALTYFSNELLADSTPAADIMVRDDLIRVIALLEDKAFLLGGSQDSGSPVGIWQHTGSTTYTVSSGANTVDNGTAAPTYDTFVNAYSKQIQANSNMINPAWVMHGRDLGSVMLIKDANGQPIFRDGFSVGQTRPLPGAVYSPGNILGIPVYVSNQMPTNISSVRSGIILGDFADALIGDRQQLEVAVSSEATVFDVDGTTAVNLFATNQSAIRVIERVDFALRHAASFTVVTNVTT